ncbi:hypothetical protein EHS13_16760 [Paenibacillus psychroresistens]|uniref:Uncharacterized protein n=1 Tax=Paenibacillus psychroresistens TaxID=1778678 RepID=A0A6B8RLV8_9BACL|nr:hypothetical protein [Paenibacillus psychroresistens]QGQ96416.1 hypothetical protein EHS13_16760 [Paenibacillus psychroresistens]
MTKFQAKFIKLSISTVVIIIILCIISLLINKKIDWQSIVFFAILAVLVDIFAIIRTEWKKKYD